MEKEKTRELAAQNKLTALQIAKEVANRNDFAPIKEKEYILYLQKISEQLLEWAYSDSIE